MVPRVVCVRFVLISTIHIWLIGLVVAMFAAILVVISVLVVLVWYKGEHGRWQREGLDEEIGENLQRARLLDSW